MFTKQVVEILNIGLSKGQAETVQLPFNYCFQEDLCFVLKYGSYTGFLSTFMQIKTFSNWRILCMLSDLFDSSFYIFARFCKLPMLGGM